mgnify:CR=1 FL=1
MSVDVQAGGGPALFGGYDDDELVGLFNPATGSQYCSIPSGGSFGSGCSCAGVSSFTSAIDGTQKSLTRDNVADDAKFQAIQMANTMRANGTIVYSMGLGNNVDVDFLQRVANDPDRPGHVATYYDGEALIAPTAADLKTQFDLLAKQIILRLTR